MKKRYVFHPDEYDIGLCERFYQDMAARGWLLEWRGERLSRFAKAEPSAMRYRIELSSPAMFDDERTLPDEQVALYEECGWRLVAHHGLASVFCAPEGSDAPEPYDDPRQQAATLKALRRSYALWWLPVALVLGFDLLMASALAGGAEGALAGIATDIRMKWYEQTAFMLLLGAVLLWSLYSLVRGGVMTGLLYRRLKAGLPPDRSPRRALLHRVIAWVMAVCCAASAAGMVWQWAASRQYPMPQVSDGAYITMADLGWTGERGLSLNSTESSVRHSRSLAAEHWDTGEFYSHEQSPSHWMYQDVYTVSGPEEAMALAELLMADALFSRDDFRRVDAEGLDAAWCGRLEYVAVKGSTVWFISCMTFGADEDFSAQVFAALAAK